MVAGTGIDPAQSIWGKRLPLVLAAGYIAFGILYILFSDRLVLLLVDDPARLTAIQTFKGWGYVLLTGSLLYLVTRYGVNRLRESDRAGRAADEQFRRVIETANEGVWLVDDTGRTISVNRSLARLLRYEPNQMHGRPVGEFAHPDFRRVVEEQHRRCCDGEQTTYECRLLARGGDTVWAIIACSPIHDADGRFAGSIMMVTDITQRKAAEDALRSSLSGQRQLLNELDHRVRNNLSSVLSLVQLARSAASDTDTFAEAISGRVKAMSRAYSMLSASGWSGQDLGRLIDTLVPGELRDRVTIRGGPVVVPPQQMGALALLVHELITNATRHGALGSGGRVEVTWSIDSSATDGGGGAATLLELRWIESDGRPIEATPQPRSGYRLIEGLCRSDLRGSATLQFTREGARHSFEMRFVESRPSSQAVATASS